MSSQEPKEDLESGELGLPLPSNHAELPSFEYLIDFLEGLARISGPGSKVRRSDKVNQFIAKWRTDIGDDIYPAFQLILPQVDSDIRQLYNLKETALARILVRALELNPKGSDAQQLLEFRRSTTGAASRDDGLAVKAERAIAKRNTQVTFSSWTLDKVISRLVSVSQGTKQQREAIFKEMLEAMNAVEMKWIVRIVLRHMQLNCSEKTFFQCWHPNAQVLFNVTNNLKIVCNQLWNPSVRLEAADQSIRPLACFKPMRAKFVRGAVADLSQVIQRMQSPKFYIEEKIDGERIQLHYTDYGRKCRYLSRRGKDFTEQYGSNAEDDSQSGSLSPHLSAIINPKVESCILDGEMAAWDSVNEELCALGKVRQASKSTGTSQLRPLYLVFDCLHLNGQDLSRQPLRIRKQALERIILPDNREQAKGYIEILPYVQATTAQEVSKVFDAAISQMSEGIVLKNPESRYVLDGVTDAWIKVKPEFVSGYEGENFDLIVIGGYRGTGKWANRCSSFLCALRDETKEFSFVAFTRVGSGFCTGIYEFIDDMINGKWFSIRPDWLVMGQEKPPDYYIDPRESVVLEIKATEISSVFADRGADDEAYGTGYALRFPRFVRLREDKDYMSALTVGELLAYRTSVTANESRRGEKRKPGQMGAGSASIPKRLRYEANNRPELSRKSSLFEGLVFFIPGDIGSPEDLTKSDFEQLVQSHGGRKTDTIESGVLVVADRKVPSIMAIVSHSDQAILHPRWVFDSILNGRQLRPEPIHYFWGENDRLSELVDGYGFPLYRKQSLRDFGRCLNNMNPDLIPTHDEADLAAVLQELNLDQGQSQPQELRAFLFQGIVVSFDPSAVDTDTLGLMLRYGNAGLRESLSVDTTHVICDDPSRQGGYAKATNSPHIVTSEWVHSCWRERTILDEQQYRFGS